MRLFNFTHETPWRLIGDTLGFMAFLWLATLVYWWLA